jgi:pimeloyl-ACP methyl ester carboxylesterase
MSVFSDCYFQTDDGLRLYARDYPGPTDLAPVALCLHGLTRNSRDFQDLAPDLAAHFRVLVPEQRGRGLSDYDSDASRYTIIHYVQDTYHLLQSLEIEHVAVVGTSMGGLMTFALNALYPGLIVRAVINDIGPEIAPEGLERIKSYVGVAGPFDDWASATAYLRSISGEIFPQWNEDQWHYFASQTYVERDGKIVIDYDPRIVEPLKEEGADTEADTLWSMFDALASVPTLLVRGALTDLLSEHCVAKMGQHHRHLDVLTVPNVGHAPMLNEAGVSDAIQSFLTE